jgi:putative sigma-54 modulation protein
MNIIVSGKNMVLTDALRDTVVRKLSKLNKYFLENTEAQVTLKVEKLRQIVEVTIRFDGGILRCEEASEDMYASIDRSIDVLERQIAKHKTKIEKRYKNANIDFSSLSYSFDKDSTDGKIVKTKRFAMKPMSVEEASLQMELLDHSFFVFYNPDTDEVNVLYKRKDGNYGLIEPEF